MYPCNIFHTMDRTMKWCNLKDLKDNPGMGAESTDGIILFLVGCILLGLLGIILMIFIK